MTLALNKYMAPRTVLIQAILAGLVALALIGLMTTHVYADHCPDHVDVAINVGQGDDEAICGTGGEGAEGNVIFVYLKYIINFMAVGVGIAVTASLVWAGFQYITSEGNPQRLSGAKNRIFHSIVALILFISMYAILQFLIPGGLL